MNGKLDIPTVKALQEFLSPSTFSLFRAKREDDDKKQLPKTGTFDAETKKWLQNHMNANGKKVTADGEFGKDSVIALQSLLNNTLVFSLPNVNIRVSAVSGVAGVCNGLYLPDGEWKGSCPTDCWCCSYY